MYTPPAQGAPFSTANAPADPNAVALVDDLEKLRLDFETILPLHGPGKVTRADLYAFVRKPLVPVSNLPIPAPPVSPGARGARGLRGGRGAAPATAVAVSAEDASLEELLNTVCSSCHGMERVNNKKANKDVWAAIVTRMMDHGAALTEQQAPILIEFLAKTRK